MGYKPKLDKKNKNYKVKDLTINEIHGIFETAKELGEKYLLIIRLALKNCTSLEIEKLELIMSESDRNKNQPVSSRTISRLVRKISKESRIKFELKDLNIYSQRCDISLIDF